MYPDHHLLPYTPKRSLRPDRRPLPKANEIRLRVKRTANRQEV
jgi:hypothetical protein